MSSTALWAKNTKVHISGTGFPELRIKSEDGQVTMFFDNHSDFKQFMADINQSLADWEFDVLFEKDFGS